MLMGLQFLANWITQTRAHLSFSKLNSLPNHKICKIIHGNQRLIKARGPRLSTPRDDVSEASLDCKVSAERSCAVVMKSIVLALNCPWL